MINPINFILTTIENIKKNFMNTPVYARTYEECCNGMPLDLNSLDVIFDRVKKPKLVCVTESMRQHSLIERRHTKNGCEYVEALDPDKINQPNGIKIFYVTPEPCFDDIPGFSRTSSY
jgi:hypothetical protein